MLSFPDITTSVERVKLNKGACALWFTLDCGPCTLLQAIGVFGQYLRSERRTGIAPISPHLSVRIACAPTVSRSLILPDFNGMSSEELQGYAENLSGRDYKTFTSPNEVTGKFWSCFLAADGPIARNYVNPLILQTKSPLGEKAMITMTMFRTEGRPRDVDIFNASNRVFHIDSDGKAVEIEDGQYQQLISYRLKRDKAFYRSYISILQKQVRQTRNLLRRSTERVTSLTIVQEKLKIDQEESDKKLDNLEADLEVVVAQKEAIALELEEVWDDRLSLQDKVEKLSVQLKKEQAGRAKDAADHKSEIDKIIEEKDAQYKQNVAVLTEQVSELQQMANALTKEKARRESRKKKDL